MQIPDNLILATLDVSSLYTNIPQEEGIDIVCRYYDHYEQKLPIPTHDLRELMRPILEENSFTALFNNMWTLKFKSQPTNAFFATVNLMFGGSSQLPTTAKHAIIKSNRGAQFRQHSRKLGGAAEHLIDGSEKRICRLRFEC